MTVASAAHGFGMMLFIYWLARKCQESQENLLISPSALYFTGCWLTMLMLHSTNKFQEVFCVQAKAANISRAFFILCVCYNSDLSVCLMQFLLLATQKAQWWSTVPRWDFLV